jgi:uncharacterized protein (DUF1697 family)
MCRFIALLRGINVGGHNKIDMTELKAAFESRGYTNVVTYINSGNILFSSDNSDTGLIQLDCEAAILERFSLKITVFVLSAQDLLEALSHAPEWWNTEPECKHNAIFVIPPMTPQKAIQAIGETTSQYEKISHYGSVIFWTANLHTFSHTRWSELAANKEVYRATTIRNANTVLKLAKLLQ